MKLLDHAVEQSNLSHATRIISQLQRSFDGDATVEPRVERARSVLDRFQNLRQECKTLRANKRLYELRDVLTDLADRGQLNGDLVQLRDWTESTIAKLQPATDAAEAYFNERDYERALTQARRVLEFAVDCPAAAAIAADASEAIRGESAGPRRTGRGKRLLIATFLTMSIAVMAAWLSASVWRPYLPASIEHYMAEVFDFVPNHNDPTQIAPDNSGGPDLGGRGNTSDSAHEDTPGDNSRARGGLGQTDIVTNDPNAGRRGAPATHPNNSRFAVSKSDASGNNSDSTSGAGQLVNECEEAIASRDIELAEQKLLDLRSIDVHNPKLRTLQASFIDMAIPALLNQADEAIARHDYDAAKVHFEKAGRYDVKSSKHSAEYDRIGHALANPLAQLTLHLWLLDQAKPNAIEDLSGLSVLVDGKSIDWLKGDDGNAAIVYAPAGRHLVFVQNAGRATELETTLSTNSPTTEDIVLGDSLPTRTSSYEMVLDSVEQGALPPDWEGSPAMKVAWPTGIRVLRSDLPNQNVRSPALTIAGDF
ncbi:MAG: hypothetical protein R3C10_23845, partial [Pirellulales bacterium]